MLTLFHLFGFTKPRNLTQSQTIQHKNLLTDSMSSYLTKQYTLSLFDCEISLIFAWTELIYLIIFMVKRHQAYFWSASLNIDYDPPICVDPENLAETFIGKLLSGETNIERIENWNLLSLITMYNLCKSIRIGTYTITFDFLIHKRALSIEFLF